MMTVTTPLAALQEMTKWSIQRTLNLMTDLLGINGNHVATIMVWVVELHDVRYVPMMIPSAELNSPYHLLMGNMILMHI
jgi:hypothetical protein